MSNNNMVRVTCEGVMVEIADYFGAVMPAAEINKDILFTPDDLALRMRGEKTEPGKRKNLDDKTEPADEYKLDFLNVWLQNMTFSWKRQHTPIARQGLATRYLETTPGDKKNIEMFRAVPVDMLFSMTYWTKYKDNMDKIIEAFMFWTQEDPNINLFYDDNKPLELDVIIDTSVTQDDQKIANMFKDGKYWKHTFNFTVESWMFKGVAIKTLKKIIIDMYAVDEFPVPIAQVPEALAYHGVIDENTVV